MKKIQVIIVGWLLFSQQALAEPQVAASGSVTSNTALTVTVTHSTGFTWYISGFMASCAGVTAAATVHGTITGLNGGTLDFAVGGPLGIGNQGYPIEVTFPKPIPNSTTNADVVLTIPGLGLGEALCTGVIFGELR